MPMAWQPVGQVAVQQRPSGQFQSAHILAASPSAFSCLRNLRKEALVPKGRRRGAAIRLRLDRPSVSKAAG